MSQYVRCNVCGEQVDPSVPKVFCGFCSIARGPSCPWTAKVAAPTLLFFSAHAAGLTFEHEKGRLTRSDLPRELEHIEQGSGNSTVLFGWGHAATVQVSTASNTAQSLDLSALGKVLDSWNKIS